MTVPRMTADQRVALIERKIERAKKHIIELTDAFRIFNETSPYKIGAKRDPETRKLIYYVLAAPTIPPTFALIAGDALHALRNALDHLAYQLFLIGIAGTDIDVLEGRKIYFLIERSAEVFEAKLAGKVKGMRQEAIDAIRAFEPYKGGKGHDLWVLHTLNNIDKHRLLVTVSSSYRSADLGIHMSRQLRATVREAEIARAAAGEPPLPYSAADIPDLSAFYRSADNHCPLKEGDELLIDSPDAEPNDKMQFRFDVSFNEPEIGESKPVVETLQHLHDLVRNAVAAFKPLLS